MCIRDSVDTTAWYQRRVHGELIWDMQQENIEKLEDLFQIFPQVSIDPNGKFKYIQIQCSLKTKSKDTNSKESVTFIRGYSEFSYHADIFEDFVEKIRESPIKIRNEQNGDVQYVELSQALKIRCPGGGRIEHSAEKQKLVVFGYSQSYGQPDHSLTIQLLKQSFPNYPEANFEWSNEGY
eukprot:TRINITY_DN8737_c0_g1_i5.p1 TRINITY_DN8737_c0_g1~~TRINITY_DN8737_c0_g1_i5.p1  ORF type:complete len:180 (+),score=38.15 TRINITY_DN8737_c0_g1_i5:64-603(+)